MERCFCLSCSFTNVGLRVNQQQMGLTVKPVSCVKHFCVVSLKSLKQIFHPLEINTQQLIKILLPGFLCSHTLALNLGAPGCSPVKCVHTKTQHKHFSAKSPDSGWILQRLGSVPAAQLMRICQRPALYSTGAKTQRFLLKPSLCVVSILGYTVM